MIIKPPAINVVNNIISLGISSVYKIPFVRYTKSEKNMKK